MKNLTKERVNTWVFDKKLSVEDLRLLLYLAGDPADDVANLAKLFGIANSTAYKRLGKLKKLGYIEKIKGVFQISGGEL
ncbi:helix-turn-helix domain-containing protein [uncultured Campylobacter sp.]|uniref:helix-turn-helix domain-containing protein n=1 Tax=uncultured Campylobacter sp. TaxID=218934 RepID=UPI002636AE04|nr:helix-turn-helix domain-containing protein [uncultured Campylobacter sp.]